MQLQIRHTDGKDVSIEDCARFSDTMSNAIDSSDLFTQTYVLEISSPGIGNVLTSARDFETFRGFPIEVDYISQNTSKETKEGLLHEKSSEHLILNIKGRMERIPIDQIVQVGLVSPSI